MRGRPSLLACASVLFAVAFAGRFARAQDRDEWKKHVPANEKSLESTLIHTPEATAAGQRIYEMHCDGCHGAQGQGHRNKPAVTGPDTTQATDGELFWLMRNGVISKGMPAWVTLPEAQRWQVISYVRALALKNESHIPAASTSSAVPAQGEK